MNKLRKYMKLSVKNKDGFSLVESIVATFLLTVGLLSAASVLITVAGHQKLANIFTTATNLAEEKMENLRNTNYLNIDTEDEDFGEILNNTTFSREVIVTPNAGDTLKTIEVTVVHMGGQKVVLQTLIAR